MEKHTTVTSGIAAIQNAVGAASHDAGVYRMIDAEDNTLYVGKAKHLKNRLTSYLNLAALSVRMQRVVMGTTHVEITTTRSEAEALLLEADLVKRHRPRYNILLKDDKSFPYIFFSGDHAYPRVSKYRGAQTIKGDYFGPFVSGLAVNETMALLQKAFLLRPCSDSVFKNRTRPCLQFQIKRCSAPCVGYIGELEYGELVSQARQFLSGESDTIRKQLTEEMERLSADMQFEQAASLRDRIRAITQIQQQSQAMPDIKDADVVALARDRDVACIQVFSWRGGRNFGSQTYFPQNIKESSDSEIMEALLLRYYQSQPVPKLILLSHPLNEPEVVAEALALKAGRKVELLAPQRGDKKQAMDMALANARQALARHVAEQTLQAGLLDRLAEVFGLGEAPQRIEVYDNSHIMGTNAIGAMIVATPDGFDKKAYRTFTIKQADLSPGDDFGMLKEVLTRRLKRSLGGEDSAWALPDLLLIDGGAGQLSAAVAVMEELGVSDVAVAAIAKGPDRNAGREWFHVPGQPPFQLPPDDPLLHYLQRLRDEAHRFAIGTHRNKRSKDFVRSELDSIPGIGGKRKKALLLYFGSARGVAGASVEDIARVEGINTALAKQIYDYFH